MTRRTVSRARAGGAPIPPARRQRLPPPDGEGGRVVAGADAAWLRAETPNAVVPPGGDTAAFSRWRAFHTRAPTALGRW